MPVCMRADAERHGGGIWIRAAVPAQARSMAHRSVSVCFCGEGEFSERANNACSAFDEVACLVWLIGLHYIAAAGSCVVHTACSTAAS